MQNTERGPIDRKTAEAIQSIDGGPIQATGKALVTDRRWPQAMGTDQEFTGPVDIASWMWQPTENDQAQDGAQGQFVERVLDTFAPRLTATKQWHGQRMVYALPKSGTFLKNGAIVAAAGRTASDEAIVVALTNGMAAHEFVTWRLDLKTGNAYSGEYTTSLAEAVKSALERASLGNDPL